MRKSTIRSNATAYGVQVCMPGQAYRSITLYKRNLSAMFDVYASLLRGTHKLSRKGLSVRIVAEESDATRINQSGMWRVVKRAYVTVAC